MFYKDRKLIAIHSKQHSTQQKRTGPCPGDGCNITSYIGFVCSFSKLLHSRPNRLNSWLR